jgi:hypothetical protein
MTPKQQQRHEARRRDSYKIAAFCALAIISFLVAVFLKQAWEYFT